MKRAIYLILILSLCISKSWAGIENIQPTVLQKDASGTWVYEKVIEVSNTSKDQLYERVKSWILSTIKSSENGMMDDTKHETIITSPTLTMADLKYNDITGQTLNFKLTIQFKDNKIRVSAASFSYFGLQAGTSGRYVTKGSLEEYKNYKKFISQMNEKIDESFSRFITGLQNAAKNEAKNDW